MPPPFTFLPELQEELWRLACEISGELSSYILGLGRNLQRDSCCSFRGPRTQIRDVFSSLLTNFLVGVGCAGLRPGGAGLGAERLRGAMDLWISDSRSTKYQLATHGALQD